MSSRVNTLWGPKLLYKTTLLSRATPQSFLKHSSRENHAIKTKISAGSPHKIQQKSCNKIKFRTRYSTALVRSLCFLDIVTTKWP